MTIGFNLAQAGPQGWLSNDSIDFGAVPSYSVVAQKMILKSTGDQPLAIDSVRMYCDCLQLPIVQKLIQPGDSVILELTLNSGGYGAGFNRHPSIYTNSRGGPLKLQVRAMIMDDMEKIRPIFVTPNRIVASQYKEMVKKEFPFEIVNVTDTPVPLRLVYSDSDFFAVNFPLYVPASGKASGSMVLTPKGLESQFEKSLTFEFIGSDGLRKNYTIPVLRKIYAK